MTQRLICAKELVHICDAQVSKTSDPQDIIKLAEVLTEEAEIGDKPHMTLKVAADLVAQQKGLMLLFPKAARVIARQQISEGQITLEALSEKLQLPQATVEDMLKEEWDSLAELFSDI